MGDSEVTSAEVGGFAVETNTGETSEEITQALQDPEEETEEDEKPDLKKAASDLGKKGGKAAAKARKAKEAEEASEPEKPEEQPAEEEKQESKPSEEEEKPEKDEKPLGKPRHDPRARMLEATRQAAEAKRDRDAAVAKAADLERRLQEVEQRTAQPRAPQPGQTPQQGRPSPENFDDYEQYLDARDAHNARKIREEITQEQRYRATAEAADRQLISQIDKFRESTQANVDRYSDDILSLRTEFQLQPGEVPNAGNWIANELFVSPETAPSLMLHLSEHPDDLQRIAALPNPRAVSRELAKLEARLEAATTAPPSPEREEVSKANPPVRPVAGSPSVADGPEFREDMSFDDYYARNRKKFKAASR